MCSSSETLRRRGRGWGGGGQHSRAYYLRVTSIQTEILT
jgi:hypothetical protein